MTIRQKIAIFRSTTVVAARKRRPIYLGFGANIAGAWGAPKETIDRAIRELSERGIRPQAFPGYFTSEPVGYRPQPWFVNTVVAVDCDIPPATLLQLLKRVERRAGRRAGLRWGPRPLDIDILDYRGMNCAAHSIITLPNRINLPHPGIADRGFVLLPLALAAPGWRHPILGVGAKTLMARRPGIARTVRQI